MFAFFTARIGRITIYCRRREEKIHIEFRRNVRLIKVIPTDKEYLLRSAVLCRRNVLREQELFGAPIVSSFPNISLPLREITKFGNLLKTYGVGRKR